MRYRRMILAAAAAILGFGSVPTVSAQSFDVKETTLNNGMKVLVQEDHGIPHCALYIFYRIGSRNERPGTTGLSHFFEHMMFNGAKKYGPGSFDSVMEAAGGSNNAYTTKDLTVYHETFTPSALELIFDLESDRIRDLALEPKMVASERGVVASERRSSVDNSNNGILNEQLWSSAYSAHPYQWPVVGWMVDIENWKRQDLENHFKMGYSPSNATMVVVGDVKADEVFRLAHKYIESIPSHDPPPKVTTAEPPQMGERRVVVRKFAQTPIVMVAYHVPASSDKDFYALELLDSILMSGQSSRLYKRLIDKDQIALSVYGGESFAFDPTIYSFTMNAKENVEPAILEKALYEELERVKKDGVSDKELEKAKNSQLFNFYDSMKTQSGKANSIGNYDVFLGSYKRLFNVADEFQKVTKEDVQRVAQKYFAENNRTVATLIPDKSKIGDAPKTAGGHQ